MLSYILSALLDLAHMLLRFLISLLPDSPFSFDTTGLPGWLGIINTFFPIGDMIVHASCLVGAVGLWYAVRWGMRLIRHIQ